MKQMLIGSSWGDVWNGAIRYYSFIGPNNSSTINTSGVDSIVSSAGTLSLLRVELDGTPGGGKDYTFDILKNGSPISTLSVTIADTATSGEDSGSFSVAAGDRISIRTTPSGSPTLREAIWTMIYTGDTPNESLILNTNGVAASAATQYFRIMGYMNAKSDEDIVRMVCPTGGTIKNLYVKMDSDPGTSPDAYRFTLRLNGATVGESLIVTIVANDTTGNDVAHNLAVVAGDILTLMVEPIDTPSANPKFSAGMTFVATTDGESIILGGGLSDSLSVSATRYLHLCAGGVPSITEEDGEELAQASVLKDFYVLLSGSPGSGKDYTFTIRDTGASTSTVVTIADLATTGNKTDNDHTLIDGDEVSLMVVPSGTPDVRRASWGIVSFIEPEAAAGLENKSANMAAKMMAAGVI